MGIKPKIGHTFKIVHKNSSFEEAEMFEVIQIRETDLVARRLGSSRERVFDFKFLDGLYWQERH